MGTEPLFSSDPSDHAKWTEMTTINQASGGQDHDRFHPDDSFAMARMIPAKDGGGPATGDDDISAPQKMISAMSGSLLTSLLVTPLDVVRVRWQSQTVTPPTVDFSKLAMTTSNLKAFNTENLGVTACCREVFFMNNSSELCIAMPRAEGAATAAAAECAVEEVERKTISSTMDGLRKIARNEGFTSLWRGLSPTLLMTIPGNIIYFTGYDWLRYNRKSPIAQRLNDDTAPLVAGSGARTLAAAAVSPIELFRTRMQATSGNSATGHLANTFRGIKEMVNTSGYSALWRGLTLTLWRDVPFSGIYWWGYETIRGKLTDLRETRRGRTLDVRGSRTRSRRRSQSRENHSETLTDSFIAGAVSGGFASIVTMPFDVGKTRTQVYRDSPNAAKAAAAEQGSMMRLLYHIFSTEGIQGLWKGWIPRTLKVAPACAIMISSYEVGKRVFRSVNEKSRQETD